MAQQQPHVASVTATVTVAIVAVVKVAANVLSIATVKRQRQQHLAAIAHVVTINRAIVMTVLNAKTVTNAPMHHAASVKTKSSL
jgi:hypothetical protein